MEICYYWIDRFSNVIKEQGYDFGGQLTFDFQYEQKQLIIKENNLYVKGFFNLKNDKKIRNITAIVGRNGVGKSTFLTAIKGLLIDGGILATQKSNDEAYYYKRILVFKSEDKYKVIFHKNLISSTAGTLNVVYEDNELKNRHKIEFISYGDDKNINLLRSKIESKLYRVTGTEVFSSTSCVYFSHAFDNNFYNDFSREDRKYFDISTKGLLNDIEDNFKPSNTFSNTEPNHLINKDSRFNVGVLKEFYITENKKRVELLSDHVGRRIIRNHLFFPEKAYLNLDYIIYKQTNSSFFNINPSELLRTERNKDNFNKVERYILNFVERIYKPKTSDSDSVKNSLLLVEQTYLRRIIDSYFEDVERFIFFDSRKKSLQEAFKDIDDEELEKRNLLELLDFFFELTTKVLKDASTVEDFERQFNVDQFKTLTQSYKDFIAFFNDCVLKKSSIVNVLKGTVEFVTTKPGGVTGIGSQEIGIIEITLNPKGLKLLTQFINHYEAINTVSNFIKIEWGGLSTGEDTLLGIYSRFFELKDKDVGESVVILLDEIEHSLHPEWQRRLIKNLIEYLPYVFANCKSIQIILATNVPFLIADIPTKNIVYLERNKSEVRDEIRVDSTSEIVTQTFAANIHSLLVNNFFMDSTIGEFSARKIEELIQILKPGNTEGYNYSLQEINNTIQTIGEPIIRNKLESMYAKKFRRSVEETQISRLIEDFKEEEDYSPQKVKSLLDTILLETGKEHEV
ncbi:AAA family ATPase [Priestia endophytica]|uniref:AAA family ATPase n=1 Tax=Priestia endophytica TaxID=135735 RepID=UPI000DCA7C0E|nr:AAA family ATPase [Priestia endophytica]RAS75717.1 hypothetical protein A4R27_21960 [Priestia endophytica]